MVIVMVFLLAFISAMLYRFGGAAKTGDIWDFARRSWVRDWLIPPVTILAFWLLKGVQWNYWYLLVWLLMGAAFSTYYDTIFGYDNMYAHGLGVGLATLPLLMVGMHWWSILAYAFTVSLSMGLISHKTKLHAVKKEQARGAVVILCLLIFKWIG